MKYVRTYGFSGFGLGVWRNDFPTWTVAIGPVTIHFWPVGENMQELRALCTKRFEAKKRKRHTIKIRDKS